MTDSETEGSLSRFDDRKLSSAVDTTEGKDVIPAFILPDIKDLSSSSLLNWNPMPTLEEYHCRDQIMDLDDFKSTTFSVCTLG